MRRRTRRSTGPIALRSCACLLAESRVLAGAAHPFDEAGTRRLIERDVDRARNFASVTNHFIIKEPDRPYQVSDLQAPLLVIHGTADPLFPIEHGLRWRGRWLARPWSGWKAAATSCTRPTGTPSSRRSSIIPVVIPPSVLPQQGGSPATTCRPGEEILFENHLQSPPAPATRIGLAGRRRLLPETPRPTLAMPARERPIPDIGGDRMTGRTTPPDAAPPHDHETGLRTEELDTGRAVPAVACVRGCSPSVEQGIIPSAYRGIAGEGFLRAGVPQAMELIDDIFRRSPPRPCARSTCAARAALCQPRRSAAAGRGRRRQRKQHGISWSALTRAAACGRARGVALAAFHSRFCLRDAELTLQPLDADKCGAPDLRIALGQAAAIAPDPPELLGISSFRRLHSPPFDPRDERERRADLTRVRRASVHGVVRHRMTRARPRTAAPAGPPPARRRSARCARARRHGPATPPGELHRIGEMHAGPPPASLRPKASSHGCQRIHGSLPSAPASCSRSWRARSAGARNGGSALSRAGAPPERSLRASGASLRVGEVAEPVADREIGIVAMQVHGLALRTDDQVDVRMARAKAAAAAPASPPRTTAAP